MSTHEKAKGLGVDLRKVAADLRLNVVARSHLVPPGQRWRLLRLLGVDADRCELRAGVFFGGTDVRIGRGCFINHGVFFDNTARIALGSNVYVGMNTMFLTSEHALGPSDFRAGAVSGRPITVGDGCWIGAGVLVLPGVTIGRGCVIAAGAVVTRDCEPDGLYAGLPAALKKTIEPSP